MKRRSFLQAVGGAIAAVFAPLAVAEKQNRRPELEQLAAAFRETRRIQTQAWLNNDPRVPPETVDELRLAIESSYKSVRPDDPPMEEISVHPLGMTSHGFAVDFPPGPFVKFMGLHILGNGANEREAVADALNGIKRMVGGEELIWRVKPELTDLHDFASNRSWVAVRGRAMVR